jgi:hypothetical protein
MSGADVAFDYDFLGNLTDYGRDQLQLLKQQDVIF